MSDAARFSAAHWQAEFCWATPLAAAPGEDSAARPAARTKRRRTAVDATRIARPGAHPSRDDAQEPETTFRETCDFRRRKRGDKDRKSGQETGDSERNTALQSSPRIPGSTMENRTSNADQNVVKMF
jgi:hypothetical protein